VCVYMLPYMYTEFDVYVYMVTYIHRESIRGCVKMSIYTPSVHMYVCTYLRLWAQSSNIHVGMHVFTCRHVEFGCGDVRAYMPAEFVWVCVYVCVSPVMCAYTHTEFTSVCVYIYVYTYSVYMHVCTFAYMYTDFTCGCV